MDNYWWWKDKKTGRRMLVKSDLQYYGSFDAVFIEDEDGTLIQCQVQNVKWLTDGNMVMRCELYDYYDSLKEPMCFIMELRQSSLRYDMTVRTKSDDRLIGIFEPCDLIESEEFPDFINEAWYLPETLYTVEKCLKALGAHERYFMVLEHMLSEYSERYLIEIKGNRAVKKYQIDQVQMDYFSDTYTYLIKPENNSNDTMKLICDRSSLWSGCKCTFGDLRLWEVKNPEKIRKAAEAANVMFPEISVLI